MVYIYLAICGLLLDVKFAIIIQFSIVYIFVYQYTTYDIEHMIYHWSFLSRTFTTACFLTFLICFRRECTRVRFTFLGDIVCGEGSRRVWVVGFMWYRLGGSELRGGVVKV